jgi:hypothetical protein
MMNEEPISLSSDIPFVLIGARRDDPDDRTDRVLVRGGAAGAEIVGYVRDLEAFGEHERSTGPPMRSRPEFQAVSSRNIPPHGASADQRWSSYTLAWKGPGPTSEKIKDLFDKSLPDIVLGIEKHSAPATEWALAHLIYAVQENEARLRARRRLRRTVATIYLGIVILALAITLLVLHR